MQIGAYNIVCCKIKLDSTLKCLSWYQIHRDKHLIIITIIVSNHFYFCYYCYHYYSPSGVWVPCRSFEYFIHSYHLDSRRRSTLLSKQFNIWKRLYVSSEWHQSTVSYQESHLAFFWIASALWKSVVTSQPPLCPVVKRCEFNHLEMKPVCNITPCILYHTRHNHCSLLFKK